MSGSLFKTKLGRNDPCYCGATREDGKPKKYKKCCLEKDEQAFKELQQVIYNMPTEPFERDGSLTGRPFIDTVFKGQRMRAVGGQVFGRPLDETFHLFLLRRFAETLGKDWRDQQLREKVEHQHPLFIWCEEVDQVIQKASNPAEKFTIRSVEMTGNMKALLSLSYDFYSLNHCSAKPLPKLLKRLKNKNQFQGARYEIAVAGIVARSGFDITWMNDDSQKHSEFIATHKITKQKIGFEAKSHSRDGVLGKEGAFDVEKSRVKIMDHVREAIEQSNKELPIIIFDDLNLPLTPETLTSEKEWFKQIDIQLQHFNFFDMNKTTNYGAMFITNFSWHFHDKVPLKENEVVVYSHISSKFSIDQEILNLLSLACRQYGSVPARLEEFDGVEIKHQ